MGNKLNKPEIILIKMHFESEEKIIAHLQNLIAKDSSIIDKPINLTKDTLLHFAAYHKKEKIITFLLNKGASKNVKNAWDLKPVDVVDKNWRETDEEIVEKLKMILV